MDRAFAAPHGVRDGAACLTPGGGPGPRGPEPIHCSSGGGRPRHHARQPGRPRGLRRRAGRRLRGVRVLPAERLVKLPEGISEQQAAAMMLKGMTVQYLIRRTYRVQPGETVLFHAAAGGVGLIACQWLNALGATVLGTVGTDDKAKIAKAHGCDHPIVYTREDFAKRVRELTQGKGVPVVYDSVGKSTFQGSLDCLRPFGLLISFGNASGPVP